MCTYRKPAAIPSLMKTSLFKSFASFFLFHIYSAFAFSSVSIKNFQPVAFKNQEAFIWRGAQPYSQEHYKQLVQENIQKILIFKTEKTDEVQNEMFELIKIGFSQSQIVHIPMKWKDFESYSEICNHTKLALKLLVQSYHEGTRTFFHCTAGEDRTGFLDGLLQIYIGQHQNIQSAFTERLCRFGYSSGRPGKPAFISETLDGEMTKYFAVLAEGLLNLRKNQQQIDDLDCDKKIEIANLTNELYCSGK